MSIESFIIGGTEHVRMGAVKPQNGDGLVAPGRIHNPDPRPIPSRLVCL